jgi:hypothetical protein
MMQVDVKIKNKDIMGSMINFETIISKKMKNYWTRIDAKGLRVMTEYDELQNDEVQRQSLETKLVYDFKKMHDVMIE